MLPARSPEPKLSAVRRGVKRALFNVGYYHRRLSRLEFPGVAALCYHGVRGSVDTDVPFPDLHVSQQTFEAHCRLIADTCNPISLDDFRAALDGRRALPPRPVIVTFDDGYRSVLEHALPSLERHRIPAAVFVCAEPVMQSRHYWFDMLWRCEGEDAVLRAKTLPYAAWLALRDSVSAVAEPSETHRPLTRVELQRLSESPLIEIGGHTMQHPVLALAPLDNQRAEIGGCRTALEDAIAKPVTAFAYPFGLVAEHYQPETVRLVKDAGFDLAFTTRQSFVMGNAAPLEIPRFLMLDSVSEAELAHRLVHSWHTPVSGR
jgi:peptidoglycan/xylan/chitin deacetylase (PgdA/CDA1 family)